MKSIFIALLLFSTHVVFSQTQIRTKVANGSDDVEVSSTTFYVGSGDLEVGGFDASINGKQYVAIRFQNVALPANAQISKAYIQFTANIPLAQSASVSIKCQQGNAAAYLNTENLQLRTYVPSTVTWNPPAWTVINESGLNQQTANLSAQVQAAIATGWTSGGALSFILDGNATVNNVLNARSYESAAGAGAAELVIEYTTTGGNPCVPDVTAPTFVNCPTNINLTTASTTAVATWTVPTVSDFCTANITPSLSSAPTTGLVRGSAFPIGTTTVTYTARDAANNSATPCVFSVTVTANSNPCSPDVTPPTFANCPTNINLTTASTTAVATWTVPTVSDFCTPNITPSVISAPTTGLVRGSAFPIGTTTVTYTARDAANNSAIPCVFSVSVTANSNPCSPDVTPPTFVNCPTNINLTTASTTAVATWATPTVSDFCTANITPSLSSAPTAGLASGSSFPIGATTVTYTARDAANNSATPCVFTVNVQRNTTGSTTLTIPISDGNDDVEVSATSFYVGSSDLELGGFDSANNGVQYVAVRFPNVALPANAQITKAYIQFTTKSTSSGTASIAIKCQKGNAAAYNPSENLQLRAYVPTTLTWNPTNWTAPNLQGVEQQTVSLSALVAAATTTGWTSGNALSFILQGNASIDNVINARSYETFPTHEGAATLVIEYTTSGNPCSPDVVAPVFSNCPANINIATAGTTGIANWTAPTVSDFCTANITPVLSTIPTAGLGNGSAFPLGVTTVSYTARDAANNAATPCVFTVTVAANNPCVPDIVRPIITNCPANITLTTAGTAAVATWTTPTVTDFCSPNITPSVQTTPTVGLVSGSAFPIGVSTVTYNARDAANNLAQPCVFTISVSATNPCIPDLTKPVITNCPANISLTTAGTTAVATWTTPTVTDFCTLGITPSVSTSPTAGLVSGSAFPIGVTTVTYNAKDLANNAAIPCIFTVTVSATNPCIPDVTKPVITNCPANISLTTAGTTAVATWTTPTVTDFCTLGITPSVTTSPTAGLVSGSAFPIGVTTVTYNAKDLANNAAIPCIFTVTVSATNPCVPDVVPPVITKCPFDVSLTTSGTTAVATWIPPTVTDLCTLGIIPTVSTSPTVGLVSGSAFPLGVTTATYNARDAANNAAIPCIFTVTVTNSTPTSTLFINEVAPQGTIAINADWIELYNDGTTAASLNDVYITNKIANPFKWQLTGLTIPAKGFLLLLADNDTLINRTHLNFKVSASGEKIYLNRNVNGVAVQLAFFDSPTSPPDEDNVTFGGLIEGQPTPLPAALTKFLGGTPNAANAGGLRYVKVSNSLPRGILTAPATATLTSSAGVTVRYTTDNSFPSRTNGIIYTQPIPITTTTVLKTFAYSGNSETKVEAFTYIFPVKGPELTFPNLVTAAEYESGMKLLPIVSLSTTIDTLDNRTEKKTSFEYISKFGQNTSIGVICGVNGYGNDSYIYSDQRNLRMSFKNEYGFGNLEFPIFTRDPVDNYNPTTKFDALDLKIGQDGPNAGGFSMLMTSQSLISKNMREMGNIDLHTQYAHAFVNGKYHGIYTFKEHWDEHFAQTYYGGNKDFYDQIVEGVSYELGDINVNSSGQPQGNLINWIALRNAGRAFDFQLVKTYLNMQQYIDYQLNVMMFDAQWEYRAFADQSLIATKFVFENHDNDGALLKTKDPYITAHDLKWGTTVDYPEIFNGPGGVFGHIYDSGNKEFRTLVRDRVYEAMQKPNGALTAGRLSTKLNELRSVLLPAFNMELARFNKTFYNNNPYYDEEFNSEIAYLPTRFTFTLNKWLEKGLAHTLVPVTFNQPSGTTITTPVLATNPNNRGVIYYTVNGTDPMGNEGIISPSARLYTSQLVLGAGVNNVVARVYFNTEFGPKTTATYTNTSVFAIVSAQTILAEGRIDGDKAIVNWYSKTTQGADYFKVEKLNANGDMETIATVNAQLSIHANDIEAYTLTDAQLNEGDNVYRVALYSDGAKKPLYSEFVTVKYSESHLFDIHPNPTTAFIDVDLKTVENKAVTISVFNSIGTILQSEKIAKASASQRINVESLQDGQYFMAIQAQGKRVVMKKFMKMR
jgi:HYR domain/Secretion system C-terminal sorting domain/Fn3 associated/CotH kinase protein